MEVFKKSIILSPASYDGKSEEKGILTLQKELGKVKGMLKCFNLGSLQGKLLLGLTFDDKILHKFDVQKECVSLFSFSLPQEVDLSCNISCVLVEINKTSHHPIIWGSTTTSKVTKLEVLQNMLETVVPVSSAKLDTDEDNSQYLRTQKQTILQKETIFEDNEEEVENLIDDEFEKLEAEEKAQTLEKQLNDFMPYKELFQTSKSKVAGTTKKEEVEEPKPIRETEQERQRDMQHKDWFYDEVKDQIEALFEKYEREKALEEIIPNARFVRVNFDSDSDSYIFGIIYDDNELPEYIVYGIPSATQKLPPEQLEGYYQWLPLDPDNPEEDGYFLMYQDARTGEHVKIEII